MQVALPLPKKVRLEPVTSLLQIQCPATWLPSHASCMPETKSLASHQEIVLKPISEPRLLKIEFVCKRSTRILSVGTKYFMHDLNFAGITRKPVAVRRPAVRKCRDDIVFGNYGGSPRVRQQSARK